jgi:hypothetical protein
MSATTPGAKVPTCYQVERFRATSVRTRMRILPLVLLAAACTKAPAPRAPAHPPVMIPAGAQSVVYTFEPGTVTAAGTDTDSTTTLRAVACLDLDDDAHVIAPQMPPRWRMRFVNSPCVDVRSWRPELLSK